MQALNDLSHNLNVLMQRYQALQEECAQLREQNERQRDELIQTYSELKNLREKNRRLATANAMTMTESNEDATKRINALIAQVDRAIQALNK